jgi:hypothetical protein
MGWKWPGEIRPRHADSLRSDAGVQFSAALDTRRDARRANDLGLVNPYKSIATIGVLFDEAISIFSATSRVVASCWLGGLLARSGRHTRKRSKSE